MHRILRLLRRLLHSVTVATDWQKLPESVIFMMPHWGD